MADTNKIITELQAKAIIVDVKITTENEVLDDNLICVPIGDAINILKDLQEQNKWHLCSDELPNHKKYVLAVCVDCDNEIIMSYYDEEAECWVYDTTDGIESCEVIAWMELPKFEEKKTCFDCKNHMMSDCYLECKIQNRINNNEICEKFEEEE